MDRLLAPNYPSEDRVFPHTFCMQVLRKTEAVSATAGILAENLGKLMASHAPLSSNPKLSEKTGLTTSTLSRIRNAKVDATVGTLEQLAKAFQVQPWEMLVPGFDPKNRPALAPVTEQERALYAKLAQVAKEIKEGT